MKSVLKGLAIAGLSTAGLTATAIPGAQAEPLKIAMVETLSGGQSSTGKMFLATVEFALTAVAGFDGSARAAMSGHC